MELREPIHRLSYRVIYGDTDTGGVVYYGNYLRIFEMGRTEFLRSMLKISYRDLEHEGLILPVSEAYCRYKASAHYDDLLEISTSLENFSKFSIRFHFLIHRFDDQHLLAKGYTVHAATDRSGRLIRLPENFQKALAGIRDR
ncbi:MAG: thioesterase [Deltaproteobacteria bacterium]|nr:MAG: thioesterase [Deltaproteobacteria bacterium]